MGDTYHGGLCGADRSAPRIPLGHRGVTMSEDRHLAVTGAFRQSRPGDLMKPPQTIRLNPGKRILFLTKNPELIRRQLRGELDLRMEDLAVEDLLDDINTDAMTPAWVCFSHRPEDIARD